MESNEGRKDDGVGDTGERKLPWALLPFDALEEVVKALQHGATKYGDRNWERGMNWSRLLSATFRHLVAFTKGETKDPETGLHHLAQAICNLLFLLAYVKRGVGKDDISRVDSKPSVSDLVEVYEKFYTANTTPRQYDLLRGREPVLPLKFNCDRNIQRL